MEDLILLGLAHSIASYLVMCCLTNKILGFQIESKKPGKGSASMEPVAVKKVLEVMIQDGTRIGMFVSDRCSNIGKVVRVVGEKYMVNIDLEFDVWHLVKSILKEVRQIKELQPWLETIKEINHLTLNFLIHYIYFCISK